MKKVYEFNLEDYINEKTYNNLYDLLEENIKGFNVLKHWLDIKIKVKVKNR